MSVNNQTVPNLHASSTEIVEGKLSALHGTAGGGAEVCLVCSEIFIMLSSLFS